MNPRERITAVLHGEAPDVIPVSVYANLLPRGYEERKLRNLGLSLVEMGSSVYGLRTPNVTVETVQDLACFYMDDRLAVVAKQKQDVERFYRTPTGALVEKFKWNYSQLEWPTEWVIKTSSDYQIVKSIVNETEYFPNDEEFLKSREVMGEDGIVVLGTPRSPLQTMLVDLMGLRKFAFELRNNKVQFDDLHETLRKKELELYKLVSDSPAEVCIMGDNITGTVTNPKLFENYCVPFYQEIAQILHQKGKVFGVHCDGKLKCLTKLIGQTDIDVIEGFTPPPVGDLEIDEARKEWKNKILWTSFPATLSINTELDKVKEETLQILRRASPGDHFAIGITEDIGDVKSIRYAHVLQAITETVNEHGKYPLRFSV
jgi:hypothetical protein